HELLNQVRRFQRLTVVLRAPESLRTRPPDFLADVPPLKLIPYTTNLSLQSLDVNPAQIILTEVSAPPPTQTKLKAPQKVKESVLLGNAVTKVMPVYPASARSMNAYGEVEVQVIISEEGTVTEAKAISGHPALRSAAVDAARKWTFKPSTFNGASVKVQSVLTFVFAPRTQ